MMTATSPQHALGLQDPVIAGYLSGFAVFERGDDVEPVAELLPVALTADGGDVFTAIGLARSCPQALVVRSAGPWAGIALSPWRDWEGEGGVLGGVVVVFADRGLG